MKLFNPDTSFYNSYYDKDRFLLAWRISVAFTSIFTIITILYAISDFKAAITSGLVLLTGIFCILFLHFTKKFKPLFWVYAISGSILANLSIFTVMNFTHYVDFMWILVTIFLAFIGINRKAGFLMIGLNLILISIYFYFFLNTHIEVLPPRSTVQIVSELIEITFVLFVFSYLIYQFVEFQNYSQYELKKTLSELEKTNQVISSKNKENTLLLKEIHHRVKNNLQIIISLLRLQKNNLSAETEKSFEEAISRIMTMSLIHKTLYQSENLNTINFESYVTELVNTISSYSCKGNIQTTIHSDYNQIGTNTMVPLGLMLNELLTNSFKHAFNDNLNGVIHISIQSDSNHYFALKYSDNGTWKNPPELHNHFGMELIETLTEQLEGSFVRKESSFVFNLKNLDLLN
ncbi:MAG: hypothetical protein HUU48_05320 [Flavobacteriales bacterium]|nr:hypothetical protein [Flavobacteriales bacterium]